MIAQRESSLDVAEIRLILGDDAEGLTDAEIIELNEQMAALAGVLCDAALDVRTPATASLPRGKGSS